jgi:hypothetical protein
MGDVKEEEGNENNSREEVEGEEETVAHAAGPVETSGCEESEEGESEEPSDGGAGAQFVEGARLDVVVDVECGVEAEKGIDDAARETVPRIETLVGGAQEEDERRVARLHGQHVMQGELGSGDDAEAFGEVQVVC